MRRPILVAFLTLIAPFFAAGSGAISAGCGRCAAACSNVIEAEGKIALPANATELELTLCLNDDCDSAKMAVAQSDTGNCGGFMTCELTTSGGETVLRFGRDVSDGPVPGDMIHIKVDVVDSGENLVDKKVEMASVIDSNICGMECTGASVSF